MANQARPVVGLAILFSLLLPTRLLAAPDAIFRIQAKADGVVKHTWGVAPGSWSYTEDSSVSGVSETATVSGSATSTSLTVNGSTSVSGGTGAHEHQTSGEHLVEVYVRGTASASIAASFGVSGNVSVPTSGNAESSYVSMPWDNTNFLLELTTTGSASDSDSVTDSEVFDVGCGGSPYGTLTLSEYPGVTYHKVAGYGSRQFKAYSKIYGSTNNSSSNTASTTFTVTLGASAPVVVVDGPYVGGSPSSDVALDSSVTFYNRSHDPDNANGTEELAGICAASWTVTYPDGSYSTSSGLTGVTFTANLPGPYVVNLVVTDNEGNTAEDEVTFTVGEEWDPSPGTDAEDDFEQYADNCTGSGCDECGGSGTGNPGATPDNQFRTAVKTGGGNTHVTISDPVPTRGYPLQNNIHINSQSNFSSRFTILGGAAFTYGIEIRDALVNSVAHRFLIDGDGSEFDFGVASGSLTAPPGFYAQLTNTSTGYLLTGAGAPEEIFRAGNYSYEFGSTGALLSITDPGGNTQTLTYDSSGYLTHVEDINTGKLLTFEYDTPGYVARIVQNGSGATTHLAYTGGKITSVILKDSLGVTVRSAALSYNTNGLLFSVTKDGDSATTITFSYSYAGNGVWLGNYSYTGGGSGLLYFSDPGSGAVHRTSRQNAYGSLIHYNYDANGDLIRITYPKPNGATSTPVYTFTHDSNHNRLTVSDGVSTYDYSYNSLGLVTEVDNNSGGVWTYGYSGADLTSVTDSVGTALTLGYTDSSNPHRVTTVTDGNGDSWGVSYNGYGQVTSTTPPTGAELGGISVTYDETTSSSTLGYPLSITNGAGDIIDIDSYSPLGDITGVSTYPVSGTTNSRTFSYDGAQRETQVTHPDSKTFETVYTGRNVTQTVDEAGTITDFEHCAICGLVTEVSEPLSKVSSWSVSGDFDITGFTDARSYTTSYTYGSAGELKQVTYPDSSKLTYTYDNYGRFSKYTNHRANSATLSYDSAGRVSGVNFSSSSEVDITVSYNSDGTVSQVTDAGGTTSYTYTDAKQVESVSYDYSLRGLTPVQKLEYSYYPDGLLETLTWKNGTSTVASWTYEYDGAGRLTGVTNGFSETTSYTFDDEGKLLTQSNQNGTSTSNTWNHATGWMTEISNKLSGTAFAEYDLVYDSGSDTVGNLTGVTELSTDTVSYGYDALYRLTSAARTGSNSYSTSYTYDLVGNITQVNGSSFASYDNSNKFSSLSGGSYGYDSDGNTTSFSLGGVSGTFQWNDTRDKLTRVSGSGITTTYFHYDAYGRRVHRQQSSPRRHYVFSGDTLIGELHSGTPTYAYTWGSDGLVSQRLLTGTPKSLWYHYGPQGETRQLTNSSGTVVDTYLYDAYGKQIASTGSDTNPYRYGGKYGYYTDGWSGIILAGQRWYSPDLKRWLSRDPIAYDGGENLYGYVRQNPVGFVDPSGLAPFTNNSPRPVPVKLEKQDSAPPFFVQPGETADVDGVYSPDGAESPQCVKIPDNCKAKLKSSGNLDVNCDLRRFVPRFRPRALTPDDLDRDEFQNWPNPFDGRNWPHPLWPNRRD